MKVIVAGSRDIKNYNIVEEAILESGFEISSIVSGGARGVDSLGEQFARIHSYDVLRFPVTPEEWRTLGRKAGPLRNQRMAENADALVAVWDGSSRGTASMINLARKQGLKIYIHRI